MKSVTSKNWQVKTKKGNLTEELVAFLERDWFLRFLNSDRGVRELPMAVVQYKLDLFDSGNLPKRQRCFYLSLVSAIVVL